MSIAAGMRYNINNFSIGDLWDNGVTRVSLPTMLIYFSLKALQRSLNYIKDDKMQKTLEEFLFDEVDLKDLLKPKE